MLHKYIEVPEEVPENSQSPSSGVQDCFKQHTVRSHKRTVYLSISFFRSSGLLQRERFGKEVQTPLSSQSPSSGVQDCFEKAEVREKKKVKSLSISFFRSSGLLPRPLLMAPPHVLDLSISFFRSSGLLPEGTEGGRVVLETLNLLLQEFRIASSFLFYFPNALTFSLNLLLQEFRIASFVKEFDLCELCFPLNLLLQEFRIASV